MDRQNRIPHESRSTLSVKTTAFRSKTPPAKFRVPLQQYSTLPRNMTKKSSSSCSDLNRLKVPGGCVAEKPSNDIIMDVKYHLYCHANLLTLFSKKNVERNEAKMIQESENVEKKLLDVDEKIFAVERDLEKMRGYTSIQKELQEEINNYENFLGSVDEAKLDEYIRVLEEDLGQVRLKNFDLPLEEQETEEVSKCLRGMNKTLQNVSALEKNLQPLSLLHSAWLEASRNTQKEEELKNACEKSMKMAEKLVYDHCFERSLSMQESSSQLFEEN